MTETELSSPRVPAFPLVLHDPFMSVWLAGDDVAAAGTTHWTGKEQQLVGLVRVDGKTYRFLGKSRRGAEGGATLRQVGHEITPLRTIVRLEGAGIRLTVSLYASIPFLLAVALLFLYEIDKRTETRIERELDARRAAALA